MLSALATCCLYLSFFASCDNFWTAGTQSIATLVSILSLLMMTVCGWTSATLYRPGVRPMSLLNSCVDLAELDENAECWGVDIDFITNTYL